MSTRRYYGWSVVAVSIVFQAISAGLTIYMYSFWAEAWMKEFGVDRAYISLGYVSHAVGFAVIATVAGRGASRRLEGQVIAAPNGDVGC